LPRDLSPYFYEIFIKPYFTVTISPEYYDGNVLIKFKCLKNTSKIVLHMNQIEIDGSSIELRHLNGLLMNSKFEWTYVEKTQFLIIEILNGSEALIQNNSYSIGIRFKGFLKNDNAGFYKSFYLDNDGNKRLKF